MKPRFSIYEVLFAVIVVLLLALLLLPRLAHHHNGQIYCLMNVRQIDDAFIVWAGDHNGEFPMQISVTNGGAMELAATLNVAAYFKAVSGQPLSPRALICPYDTVHIAATNFGEGFNNSHISYFVGLDTSVNPARRILTGDANLAVGGLPVTSGLMEFPANSVISFTANRHPDGGNLGFADGHAEEFHNSTLSAAFQETGLATNRLAIP
jgi:prepilin-type processing-associated H-X9-DG protein